MRSASIRIIALNMLVLASACGGAASLPDAGASDAGASDAGASDAGTDAIVIAPDAGGVRIGDPSTPHGGHTNAEWAQEWWRWAMEIPMSVSPLLDHTGASFGEHQTRDVTFLAGNFGGPDTRTVVIPAGRTLFFPISNARVDDCGRAPARSETQLEADAMRIGMNPDEMRLEIDGQVIGSTPSQLSAYFVTPQRFSYEVPADDSFFDAIGNDFEGHCEPSYTSGYWITIEPLSPGSHMIHFSFHAPPIAGLTNEFSLDITYMITVEA